jgi:dolichol-phosphate mannosyltransferase
MTDLSIVLPVFNEAESLKTTVDSVVQTLSKMDSVNKTQIVLVDDGSGDKSWTVITEICRGNSDCKAIRFTRNFGKEAAISAGLAHAEGDAVVVMDADGQHPCSLIPELYSCWKNDGVDVVSAKKIRRQKESVIKRISGQLYYWTFRIFTGMDLANATDFKLISKQVARTYLALPERNKFFRGLVKWTGYAEKEIPFETTQRNQGNSGWGIGALFRYAESTLISFATLPLRLVMLFGMITLIITLALTIQTLWNKFFGQALPGFTTVIIVTLFIGSVLMISLGIIGSYLAKLVEEVKQRPS